MKKLLLTTVIIGVSWTLPAAAATVMGWNTDNVDVDETQNVEEDGTCLAPVGETCLNFGEVGTSEVYDTALNPDGSIPSGATTSATIAFTSREAFTPGIEVDNTPYTSSGPTDAQRDLDGCILASSSATCTSEFQSGKRIKQKMTTADAPVDLVFNIDPASTETEVYQVFGRLINTTGQSLEGFKLELGFGVGDTGENKFVAATAGQGISFADTSQFLVQPDRTASAGTQFPFGLFGGAADNQNFLLDGFFDSERTGLNAEFSASETILASMDSDYFGNYEDIPGDYGVFGPWKNQADVQDGLFWDFDQDELTDDLLVAWQLPNGEWEMRRSAGKTCDPDDANICTPGQTLAPENYVVGSLEQIKEAFAATDPEADIADLGDGPIEDLSNLNLNYAIALGDLSSLFPDFAKVGTSEFGMASFTLRTTVFATEQVAPVPLPAGGLLLLSGLAGVAALKRRKKRAA